MAAASPVFSPLLVLLPIGGIDLCGQVGKAHKRYDTAAAARLYRLVRRLRYAGAPENHISVLFPDLFLDHLSYIFSDRINKEVGLSFCPKMGRGPYSAQG